MCEGDVRHNATPEKSVFKTALGAVKKLVNEYDVAGFVFLLQRADRADADDPGDIELFHRPDVGAMIQFTRQYAVTPPVPGQKNYVASGQFAREQVVRGRPEWRFDLHPFLVCEAFDVVKPRAANDSNAKLWHMRLYSIDAAKSRHRFYRLTPARGSVKLRAWKIFIAS
jgi:hypothetical protein